MDPALRNNIITGVVLVIIIYGVYNVLSGKIDILNTSVAAIQSSLLKEAQDIKDTRSLIDQLSASVQSQKVLIDSLTTAENADNTNITALLNNYTQQQALINQMKNTEAQDVAVILPQLQTAISQQTDALSSISDLQTLTASQKNLITDLQNNLNNLVKLVNVMNANNITISPSPPLVIPISPTITTTSSSIPPVTTLIPLNAANITSNMKLDVLAGGLNPASITLPPGTTPKCSIM